MENITCKLNGIKYLLVERIVTERNVKEFDRVNKKYECINQGVSKVEKETFFTKAFMIVKILVPEQHIMAWHREQY